MKKIILYLFVLITLCGCAAQRTQMTRAEYLQATQRAYKNISADKVLDAAKELFDLADGDDFKYQYTNVSLTAKRSWLVYLVLGASSGVDVWNVNVQEQGPNSVVSVSATTMIGGLAGFTEVISNGTALYDLFWTRLEYLLGLRKEWMTCEMSSKRIKAGDVWGNDELLCNSFNMKDSLPKNIQSRQQ